MTPPRSSPPPALLCLGAPFYESIYGPDALRQIEGMTRLLAPAPWSGDLRLAPDRLEETEVIFGGWGTAWMDEAFLDRVPRLRAVFYGAGTARAFLTPAVWEREITVCTAAALNAIPVAEYCLAAILFGLKGVLRHTATWSQRTALDIGAVGAGAYGSTVGLVSYGLIARRLRALLRPFDLQVQVYDPFLGEAEAAREGVQRVDLDTLFAECDVVSLHTPLLDETRGMIRGRHLARMKPGATFLNTARGAVVDAAGLAEVFARRDDLTALLDVTDPEPLPADSPLRRLGNVFVTPHIAGAQGAECRRLGQAMIEECRRWIAGEALAHELTRERFERTA